MNEKFTPGPWEVHDCSFEVDKSRLIIGHRQDGRLKIICRLPRKGDQENYANAVLMKAAPEMYEALNDCHSVIFDLLASIMEDEVVPDTIIAEAQEQLDEIRDMLKKARGEIMNNGKKTCIDCKEFRAFSSNTCKAGICSNPACGKIQIKHVTNPICRHFVEKKAWGDA